MAGSIGELTALVRLARHLPNRTFRVSYAELLRAEDPHPRVDRLLASLGGIALLATTGGAEGVKLYQRRLARMPDAVVLSSFRAFFQFPAFPHLIQRMMGVWRRQGIRILSLDPCGDSMISAIPEGVSVLLPRPFTYAVGPAAAGMCFSSPTPGRRPLARRRRWLWTAAPWMLDFARLRVAERLAFFALSHLDVELSVLSPLDAALPFLGAVRRVDEHLPYAELDAELARHQVLVTANPRSVLAARAAAQGLAILLVEPVTSPMPSGYDKTTADLLRAAAVEPQWPALVPLEFRVIRCAGPEATVASFQAAQREAATLRRMQRARCREYETLPSAAECLTQMLSTGDGHERISMGGRRAR